MLALSSFHVTGAPALIIILIILALLGTGIVVFVKFVGRGAKRMAGKGENGEDSSRHTE